MNHLTPRSRGLVAIFVGILIFAGLACATDDPPVAGSQDKDLEEVARQYQIEMITTDVGYPVKTYHGPIAGRAAEEKALQVYIPLFVPEFTLYPPELVKRSGLKRVVLCGDLAFDGQRRNAIPDYEHDTLYLDVARGAYDKNYLRKVIHHEFFHVIDYRDDGLVYEDKDWKKLNPPRFQYGEGGRFAQDKPTTSLLNEDEPGFLNHYSTTGVEEDKAELFANLIVEPSYIETRIKKDKVLETKVNRMKKLLADFTPEMNDPFWSKVNATRRSGRSD